MLSSILRLLLCSALAASASQGESAQEEKDKAARFSSSVDQVVLYAAVYNAEGQLASDLTRDDFSVFENKVEQQITYFGLDDVTSTIGIVMDSSGSMRGKVDMVNKATDTFLEMNNPDNELYLIEFKDQVRLEEDLTRDPEDIRDSLANIIISGGTALYDAIYLAAEKSKEGAEPKKALLVFTDGNDMDSFYRHDELLVKVREADVQIYIVAFLDSELSDSKGFFGMFKSEREKVEKEINAISDFTGGKAFFPAEIKELNGIFETIARELRNQYRIAYTPTNRSFDGKWRDIDVVVKGAREKGLKIRVKKGYYAK